MNLVEQLLSYNPSEIKRPVKVFKMKLAKLGGTEFEFPIQALDTETACKIQDIQFRILAKQDMEMESNMYEAKMETIKAGCPSLFNAKIRDHFNVVSNEQLISKLMTPAEIDKLKDEIDNLTGYEIETNPEKVDVEVKN